MRKEIKTTVVVLALILGLMLVGGCAALFIAGFLPQEPVAQTINRRWALSSPLPETALCEYAGTDNTGWDASGIRYHVFSFTEPPVDFLAGFSAETDEAFETAFFDTVGVLDEAQTVPPGQMPDLSGGYLWQYKWTVTDGASGYDFPGGAEKEGYKRMLYMIYTTAGNKLYVCQKL